MHAPGDDSGGESGLLAAIATLREEIDLVFSRLLQAPEPRAESDPAPRLASRPPSRERVAERRPAPAPAIRDDSGPSGEDRPRDPAAGPVQDRGDADRRLEALARRLGERHERTRPSREGTE